jgi:tRNA(Ile)-lysidine synthase
MSLNTSFLEALFHHYPATGSHRFLLAISGGLDSVVLAHLSKEARIPVTLAHCNFGLRGAESDRDQAFVQQLAENWGLPLVVKHFDTAQVASEQRLSVQEAARNLRYQWFSELQEEQNFSCTLLAHHADDNIETMLINLFRGTGLQGLTGMREVTKEGHRLLRPLLRFRRSELEQYAIQNNLRWVEDSSNLSTKYTRNFFRLELIPSVQKVFPRVEDNLLDTMNRLNSVQAFFIQEMEAIKRKVVVRKGEELHLPVRLLKKFSSTPLIFEIIRQFGFTEKQVGEVVKLMEAGTGRYIQNETHQIIKHRLWLVIAPRSRDGSLILVGEDESSIPFAAGRLLLERSSITGFRLQKENWIAQVDACQLQFPLLLRKWKTGDYFYPLGMRKKKKIARFLIDQKLSKSAKENIWIIESGGRIVWVAGHRIDDRFKVTEATREVIILKLTTSGLINSLRGR